MRPRGSGARDGEDPWDRVARQGRSGDFLSAVEDAVDSPLEAALDAIRPARSLTVADLGCGTGPLLGPLAARFGRVIGIDRSAAMLDLARLRVAALPPRLQRRIELQRRSLLALRPLAGRIDVAVTVNSILMPEPGGLGLALGAIRRALRPGGILLAVFPALEAVREVYAHCWRLECRRGRTPAAAWRRVRQGLGATPVNFALGLIGRGALVQRHLTRHEIEQALATAGFSGPGFGRIGYGRRAVWPGVERFAARPPELWHWFVRAERPARAARVRQGAGPAPGE